MSDRAATAAILDCSFESELAAKVLDTVAKAKARAGKAAESPGNRRAWGTVPPVMKDKLRAGLLAHLRELRSDLELVKDLVGDVDHPEPARAKAVEEALLGLG